MCTGWVLAWTYDSRRGGRGGRGAGEGEGRGGEGRDATYLTPKPFQHRGTALRSPRISHALDLTDRSLAVKWIFLPGMMYVNDLSADSICDTELAFFSTKSSYMLSHFDGARTA